MSTRAVADARQHVVVYEPNGINPYGTELAELIAEHGRQVQLFVARDAEWQPGPVSRGVLAASGTKRAWLAQAVDHLLGPLRAARATRRSGAVLVVVWTVSAWDTWVMSRVARRSPSVVIRHNPGGREPFGCWRARSWRRLLERSVPVVHADQLLAGIDADERQRYSVVPHLPYVRWREWALARSADRATGEVPPGRRFLLMGLPREDKGVSSLPSLVQLLAGGGVEIVVCGKGSIETWLPGRSEKASRSFVVDRTSAEFVPAAELASELSGVGCLMAPYTAATQSGTVVMALTWGLGVVAYDCGGLADLVQPRSLVMVGDTQEFARRVLAYADRPWPSAAVSVPDWRASVARAWLDVLDAARSRAVGGQVVEPADVS